MNHIYLDWNATTPPLQAVLDAVSACSEEHWGNPSSSHHIGRTARATLEQARERVGKLVDRPAFDVVFTSGGTESNNLAVRAHLERCQQVLCARTEHPSVTRVIEPAEHSHETHWLGLDHNKCVDPDDIARYLSRAHTRTQTRPALVIVQWVNHETGLIQPVEEIIRVSHEHGALVHVDAVQGVGKIEGRPWAEADTIALSAHKIRGPKGIGALIGAACSGLRPLILGGSQERKLRAGTVSVPLAAGFGVAAVLAEDAPMRYEAVSNLRDRIENAVVELGAYVNGRWPRVPHVLNFSFDCINGDEFVAACDVEGLCISRGSACSASITNASPIVAAMYGIERGIGAVRISLGDETTEDEVDCALEIIRRVVNRSRC